MAIVTRAVRTSQALAHWAVWDDGMVATYAFAGAIIGGAFALMLAFALVVSAVL